MTARVGGTPALTVFSQEESGRVEAAAAVGAGSSDRSLIDEIVRREGAGRRSRARGPSSGVAHARNKIYFTCSPEDAHALARHTLPELDEHDLAHLDAYICLLYTSPSPRDS